MNTNLIACLAIIAGMGCIIAARMSSFSRSRRLPYPFRYLIAFCLTGLLLFKAESAAARPKIPLGKREVIKLAANLPDTDEYRISENGHYMDLGVIHEEFNIAYILPLWITKEPRLVGFDQQSESYYELTPEQMTGVLKANNLEEKKLLGIGFYTRYGGKLVGLLLIGLIIYGILPSKQKKVAAERV